MRDSRGERNARLVWRAKEVRVGSICGGDGWLDVGEGRLGIGPFRIWGGGLCGGGECGGGRGS